MDSRLPAAVPEIPVADVVGKRFHVFHDVATPERERAAATAS
jgi:hypothetical protein